MACAQLNAPLSVTVEDEDGDSLRSLWLIDQSSSQQPFSPTPTPGGERVQRVNAPASLPFKAELANLSAGVHLLTVHVADANFNEVVNGVVTVGNEDGRGSIDSFTFVFDVEPCP